MHHTSYTKATPPFCQDDTLGSLFSVTASAHCISIIIIINIITIITIIIIIIIMFCFFLKVFIRSIPSSTKEPRVCDSCEVKFEVYCIYLILCIYINYIDSNFRRICAVPMSVEVLLGTELQGSAKYN